MFLFIFILLIISCTISHNCFSILNEDVKLLSFRCVYLFLKQLLAQIVGWEDLWNCFSVRLRLKESSRKFTITFVVQDLYHPIYRLSFHVVKGDIFPVPLNHSGRLMHFNIMFKSSLFA